MKIGISYSTLCEEELLSKLVPQYLVETPLSCRFWQRGVNDTYQVHCANESYSLRIYRHGLRTRDEIEFEIAALNYLHQRGAHVAYPITKREGGFVTEIEAPEGLRYAILTTHAKGTIPSYSDTKNARLFGASVAELHQLSEGFKTEHTRPRLDVEYLLDTSLGVIKPSLSSEDLKFIEDVAAKLRLTESKTSETKLDFGLCHGDCHGGNVHYHDSLLTHFDFDCCGFGLRVFELATFIWDNWGRKNGDEVCKLFLEGYRSARNISAEDLALVDTFVVIRHIWWMALIMGNARDFGYSDASEEFLADQIAYMKKLLDRCSD